MLRINVEIWDAFLKAFANLYTCSLDYDSVYAVIILNE